MALSASKLKVGDTHTARLVEDLRDCGPAPVRALEAA